MLSKEEMLEYYEILIKAGLLSREEVNNLVL